MRSKRRVRLTAWSALVVLAATVNIIALSGKGSAMPDDREVKKDPQNQSRIVIETPLAPPRAPEKDMDRRGRINPYGSRWTGRQFGNRRDTRRA